MGNKIRHHVDMVGLWSLMIEISSNRKCAEIGLGFTKMTNHSSPGSFSGVNDAFPGTQVVLQDGLTCKDDIGHVYHLLRGHGRVGVGC